MRKIKNSKGFTLMEMLIVVAIIAILVAIAIPTFTNSLEKAREAADLANIRSAYAEAMVQSMTSKDGTGSATTSKMTQTKGWNYVDIPDYLQKNGETALVGWDEVNEVEKGQTVTVNVSAEGVVSYTVNPSSGS